MTMPSPASLGYKTQAAPTKRMTIVPNRHALTQLVTASWEMGLKQEASTILDGQLLSMSGNTGDSRMGWEYLRQHEGFGGAKLAVT